MLNSELKKIKDIYGEEMMHFCRTSFQNILDTHDLLIRILQDNIAPTRSLVRDLEKYGLKSEFIKWINSFAKIEKIDYKDTSKTPFELMEERGYTLYKCETVEDIESFKKYYDAKEAICTFKHGPSRLKNRYIFFAVKKDADRYKREDFPIPQRDDEYSLSVLSIQFSKGELNPVLIICRYNQSVESPDATFKNNLEEIIPGLTKSFEQYYGLRIQQDFLTYTQYNSQNIFCMDRMPYIKASDGRYYRYNVHAFKNGANGEIEYDFYCCENNIIIDRGSVFKDFFSNPARYVVFDRYVADIKERTISLVPMITDRSDSFIDSINDVGIIKKMEVKRVSSDREIVIYYENGCIARILVNMHNEMIGYKKEVSEQNEKIGSSMY